METIKPFPNPYRPGAGHSPPYLAGREKEQEKFSKLLDQEVVIKNLILTGLRGTGKTVLLETLKPIGISKEWLWAGADLSESASVSENSIAIRLLTDLAVATSQIIIDVKTKTGIGFASETSKSARTLDYKNLVEYFQSQPGLVSDKLKSTLEWVWSYVKNNSKIRGIVFAYDEAQNMSDNTKDKEYPLSVLLDVFQSLQRKQIPFILVFVGLPTLLSKLVETRTYTERMFEVVELKSLSNNECKAAISIPLVNSPVRFDKVAIKLIINRSGGYPYFIQFICRETFDSFLSQVTREVPNPAVPMNEIIAKLDSEFFAGRWNNLSDRQRELLTVVATIQNPEQQFSLQEVAEQSKKVLKKSLGGSQINQMFIKLTEKGLVYKARHGKYTLGIPMLGKYILRQGLLNSKAAHPSGQF